MSAVSKRFEERQFSNGESVTSCSARSPCLALKVRNDADAEEDDVVVVVERALVVWTLASVVAIAPMSKATVVFMAG